MWHIASRFLQMLVIVVSLSVVLFGLLSAMPGNPVDMLITSNPRVKPEDVIRLKKLRGLDKPWYVQYVRWIWGYNDPYRPASVTEIPPQKGAAPFDVAPFLQDPDYRFAHDELMQSLKNENPNLLKTLEADATLRELSGEAWVDLALEKIITLEPEFYRKLEVKNQLAAVKNLELKGLFGSRIDGTKVIANQEPAGDHRVWFLATDKNGLETVGSFLIESGEQKLAVDPLPVQVVDNPQTFSVNLAPYIRSATPVASYELVDSPGKVDANGIYRHEFQGAGQTAVKFAVTNAAGQKAHGAFAVEHGPVPNPNKFNKGFLFFFAGDKNALGFSSTYKRPVWELLAGPAIICGDGVVDPGESCDDGNQISGDGCSSDCQDENLTFWQQTQTKIAGSMVTSGRIGNTLQLMFPAILLSLLIALPLGVWSAYRQYSSFDYAVNFFAFIGISLPVFWFGIMVMFVFAEKMQLFPAGGVQTPGVHESGLFATFSDRLMHAALPTLVLSIAYIGRWLRYMRASMLEVLPADYIRTARAKGLSERAVILKHALRNALIPVVTVLALSIPALFGGAVLTETVFSWPGIGRLEYDAVMNSDYYVAIVVFLIAAVLVMIGNLLADLLYVIVDPRIRHG